MSKRGRQYCGLAAAVLCYYLIHEGAHLAYALAKGCFRAIRFMGVGVQIDIFAERLTETELGLFCLAGPAAAIAAAWIIAALTPRICRSENKVFKACCYYVTIALLLLDPLYLSLLYPLFGGGDMNGIRLLVSEAAARCTFGALLVLHAVLFLKYILPRYRKSFAET